MQSERGTFPQQLWIAGIAQFQRNILPEPESLFHHNVCIPEDCMNCHASHYTIMYCYDPGDARTL